MNSTVLEVNENDETTTSDVFSILENQGILFITDYIDTEQATYVVSSLLLKSADKEPITLFINSEGGEIRDVFSIVDTMQSIKSPIKTIVLGCAMNESVLIALAGTKGMRYATKNSFICPSQLIRNESSFANLDDAKSTLDRFSKDNKEFMKLIAKFTNKKYSQVVKDFDRMKFFSSQQAIKYGMIDHIFG